MGWLLWLAGGVLIWLGRWFAIAYGAAPARPSVDRLFQWLSIVLIVLGALLWRAA